MIGYTELILIFLVVFLLFGAKRIPDLAKALGKASHEFKKAKEGLVSETEEMMNAAEKNAEAEDKLKQNGGTKSGQD
jgi:sec-independent protein translocase protein tatA/E homolog